MFPVQTTKLRPCLTKNASGPNILIDVWIEQGFLGFLPPFNIFWTTPIKMDQLAQVFQALQGADNL
jgi:hypothetical protein